MGIQLMPIAKSECRSRVWATILAPAGLIFMFCSSAMAVFNGRSVVASDPYWNSAVIVQLGPNQCSGVLIRPRIVLTAAHCLDDIAAAIAGRTVSGFIAFHGPDGKISSIERVQRARPYREYLKPGAISGDIAALLLEKDAPDGRNGTPYLKDLTQLQIGMPAVVVGRGLTENGPARELKVGDVLVTTIANEIGQFAASNETTHASACPGDSGGPVFVRIEEGLYVGGIISWSARQEHDRCDGNAGVAATMVPRYADWIDRTVAVYESGQSTFPEDENLPYPDDGWREATKPANPN